jgi:hypothetical protein
MEYVEDLDFQMWSAGSGWEVQSEDKHVVFLVCRKEETKKIFVLKT